MTAVRQLGYLGIEASDMPGWETFLVEVLGLRVSRRDDDGAIAFRLDEFEQRLVVCPGQADDVAFVGFEVACDAELNELAERLSKAGVALTEGDARLSAQRRVARVLQLKDPNGIPIELYCGALIAGVPFHSPVVPSGFVTGEEGFGHIVICAFDPVATEHFYIDLLGLRLSDRVCVPIGGGKTFDVTFLHANARHHSIGFMAAPTAPKRLHHFMIEVGSMDDVGRARDRVARAKIPLAMDLGKHPNDRMFSFYFKTPSGFDVEIGADGVKVDDTTWSVRTYDQPSLWGHAKSA